MYGCKERYNVEDEIGNLAVVALRLQSEGKSVNYCCMDFFIVHAEQAKELTELAGLE